MNPKLKRLKQVLIPRFIYVFYKGLRLTYSRKSYLVSSGLIDTYRKGIPCKTDGSPLPWMNYDVIRFLEDRLDKNMSLFEYGSGYSTSFYANLVANVVSVEFDEYWRDRIQPLMPQNVDLIFQEADVDGDYCRTIRRSGRGFDVVIVDGKDRVNCIVQAADTVSERGVIILDDSHRDRYRRGYEFLESLGFRHIEFEGLKPTGIANFRTTLFYRDGNCFGI